VDKTLNSLPDPGRKLMTTDRKNEKSSAQTHTEKIATELQLLMMAYKTHQPLDVLLHHGKNFTQLLVQLHGNTMIKSTDNPALQTAAAIQMAILSKAVEIAMPETAADLAMIAAPIKPVAKMETAGIGFIGTEAIDPLEDLLKHKQIKTPEVAISIVTSRMEIREVQHAYSTLHNYRTDFIYANNAKNAATKLESLHHYDGLMEKAVDRFARLTNGLNESAILSEAKRSLARAELETLANKTASTPLTERGASVTNQFILKIHREQLNNLQRLQQDFPANEAEETNLAYINKYIRDFISDSAKVPEAEVLK